MMKNILLSNIQRILIVIDLLITIINADPRAIIYKGKVNIGLLIAAHSSNSSTSICDAINVNGLYNSMANVWTLHMLNRKQRLSHLDDIGVFIYDTCNDETVAKRQTVRLISHLYSFGNRVCRDAKGYPPLIGVIVYGHVFDSSLDLLSSFGVPIITTSEWLPLNGPQASSGSTTFTVAPTLKYLTNAVVSLVKYLDLQSVSLVISDEEPNFDRKYLQSLAREGHFSIVKNYNDFDAEESALNESYENKPENMVFDFGRKRRHKRDENVESSSSTIFFLSKSEAIHLLSSLRGNEGHYNDNLHASRNYSWIIATLDDLPSHALASNYAKRKLPFRNNLFLISPLMENTTEYHQYFESMVKNFGFKSDQPFLSEYGHSKTDIDVPHISVAPMVKAIWALTEAYQSYHENQCISKSNCNLTLNTNITNVMIKNLESLNAKISGSGHKMINGVNLAFDESHELSTWKYQYRVMSSNWNLIPLGVYSDDNGFNINTKLLYDVMNKVRARKIKIPTKRPVKASTRDSSGTLTSLASNNLPVFKQAVYNYQNSQIPSPPNPSNLMRSHVRHQLSESSSPIGKMSAIQNSSLLTSTTASPTNDSNQVTRRRYNTLTAWLGSVWSMTILGVCILGILITLYVQTFLLMKSCEGALRKSNQGLVMFHLIAIMTTFLGSALFVFYPTSMMCSVRNSVHNLSLAMLFGSLLLRAMFIRSQKSIGLGGRTSRINQFLTLIFIIGIQAALEFQRWKYESPWRMSAIKSFNLPKLCSSDSMDYMKTQTYLSIILLLMLIMSWSARNTPFNQRDGTQVLIVSLLSIVIFIVSVILNIYLSKANYRDVVISVSMNLHAFVVLLGLFIPLLYTIHKYGVLLPKTTSYADSLSTIFTTFNGNHDLDNMSHNSGESRNSGNRRLRSTKAHGIGPATNFFARVSPNQFINSRNYNYREQTDHQSRANLIPNPLYEGVPGFRSAYP